MKERGIVREMRRQKTLKIRVGQAYLALRPILEYLATDPKEWEDSSGYFRNVRDDAGNKNPFVVEGDNDRTYRRAMKFPLQVEGNDLHNIATVLIGDGPVGNIGYDLAVEKIKGVLRDKLDTHNG